MFNTVCQLSWTRTMSGFLSLLFVDVVIQATRGLYLQTLLTYRAEKYLWSVNKWSQIFFSSTISLRTNQKMRGGLTRISLAALFALVIISKQIQPSEAFSAKIGNDSDGIKTVSVVTGANGYVGREIVHTLLSSETNESLNSLHKHPVDHEILCLVRPSRVEEETNYWGSYMKENKLKVLPYDMLDQGESLSEALDTAFDAAENTPTNAVLYHVASKFGPSENHEQVALENVAGTETTVRVLAKYPNSRLILTSSMAAVRGTGQKPLHSPTFYTHEDWNTLSKLGANWGNSYQWSKCQSEKRAWELAKELGVDMTSLCPSFVFGPFRNHLTSSSYSIELVSQWIKGESAVQSRLCVDIRDAALAHVRAACNPQTIGKRYIVSSEARLHSKHVATVLKEICQKNPDSGLGKGENIFGDEDFDGGAVKIGEKEVDAVERMKKDLGIVCRSNEETFADMGQSFLDIMKTE